MEIEEEKEKLKAKQKKENEEYMKDQDLGSMMRQYASGKNIGDANNIQIESTINVDGG
jgi:hypothetical protein